jgi:hypothetical protein
MTFVNRWSGPYFGWFYGGGLYTKDGRHVGYRKLNEIYDLKGRYLGDLKKGRLFTKIEKLGKRSLARIPTLRLVGPTVKPMDEEEFNLPDGFRDFPAPETL